MTLTTDHAVTPETFAMPLPTPEPDEARLELYAALEAEIRKHETFLWIVHNVLAKYQRELTRHAGVGNRGRQLVEPTHPDDDPETDPRLYWLIEQANWFRVCIAGTVGVTEPEDARCENDPDDPHYLARIPEEYRVR